MTKITQKLLPLFLLVFSIHYFSAQTKKTIQTEDYFIWKTIEQPQISDSGKIVIHLQTVLTGNNQLIVRNMINDSVRTFVRGKNAKIHPSENTVVFMISPDYDTIRKLKLDKVPEKKFPKDSLGIYSVSADTLIKFAKVSGFKLPKENSSYSNDWVVFLRSDDYKIKKATAAIPAKKGWSFCKKKTPSKTPEEQIKFSGKVLSFYHTPTRKLTEYEGVEEYILSENGDYCLFSVTKTYFDSIDSSYLMKYDFKEKKVIQLNAVKGEISKINWTKNSDRITYLTSADTGQYKNYQLYLISKEFASPNLILDTVSNILKPHQTVSNDFTSYFSEDGQKLFFGIGNKSIDRGKDTLTKDEKPIVDVWHWNDGRIQPHQLKTLKNDKTGSSKWVYVIDTKKFVALSDTSLDVLQFPEQDNPKFVLVASQLPYLKEMTWDYWYYDYSMVEIETGNRKKLLTHFHGNSLTLSPSGNYLHYWNHADSSWILLNTKTMNTLNLTKNISENYYKWHHDIAEKIDPEGRVFWIKEDSLFIIESQHDIWQFDISGKATKLTNGKPNNQQFSILKLDKETPYLNLSVDLVKSFNHKNKNEGLWKWKGSAIELLFDEPQYIASLIKAKNSESYLLRQSTLINYPELQFSQNLKTSRRVITSTNPQQKDYNWASVEIVHWKDFKGDSVSGLLYKPENFDSSKKYPMIVYFYERYTNNLHRYYGPKPTASIVFPTEYASNGYLIFIPDIKYEMGKPAKSAYNAIMSGTNHLTKKFTYIDSTRMGLQGQSWGGYQTAQLITMTTKFKCAMAGAPVSNMFSAYGGIRWGTGLSRTFQYETGQSRIGKTIWESPELYIENSPLFHLPKVQTPLLIMHNDQDGAVPWYQGIELYNGLRRLEKPVWLLNYNGDDHNLMKPANRIDLSIKMKGFFDHYLMNQPAPIWLEKGVPAVDKLHGN